MKKYMIPEIEVIELKYKAAILSASTTDEEEFGGGEEGGGRPGL